MSLFEWLAVSGVTYKPEQIWTANQLAARGLEWGFSEISSGKRLAWLQLPQGFEAGTLRTIRIRLRTDATYNRWLLNGFQSWSHSHWQTQAERMPRLRSFLRSLSLPYGDYAWVDYSTRPGEGHSHSWTTLHYGTAQTPLTVVGARTEDDAYLVIHHRPHHRELWLDWDIQGLVASKPIRLEAVIWTDCLDLQPYFDWRGWNHRALPRLTGWTSWYEHKTAVDRPAVTAALASAASQAFKPQIIQLDDGWQPAVGDWLTTNSKFPGGLAADADRIRKAGFTPGLWLAPFVAEPRAQIQRQHPEWFLVDPATGKPLRAGFNPGWSGWLNPWFQVLNPCLPEVQAYVRQSLQQATETWGFDFLKLDFLYSTALLPLNGLTRAQVCTQALDLIRQTVPKTTLLGCGVPLASAARRVDYCRIGPDVDKFWDFRPLAWLRNRERISNTNAIDNALTRYPLNQQAFGNDPDVFFLPQTQESNNRLTNHQAHTLFLTNILTGHLVFTSNLYQRYTPAIRRLFDSQFNLLSQQPFTLIDWQVYAGVRSTVSFRILPATLEANNTLLDWCVIHNAPDCFRPEPPPLPTNWYWLDVLTNQPPPSQLTPYQSLWLRPVEKIFAPSTLH
jgi:alpha-galactosidase